MNSLVFLVDDDRMLIRGALEAVAPGATFVEAGNGKELLDLLTRKGHEADSIAPMPDLILLDMNMPRMTGLDALRKIQATPDLRDIPTVMLDALDELKS